MKEIPITITHKVDDGFPPMVAAVLADANGKRHQFVEKDVVVTSTGITTYSIFPMLGIIPCQVESEWIDAEGRLLVRATTAQPWGVESTAGCTTFVALVTQLRDA